MLSLSAVSAGYGSFRALFDVSIEINPHEAVGVIGPNGAGKTTLLRVISGLVPLSAGEMTFHGNSLAGLSAHRIVKQGIAHIPENRRLFPRLTVEDNLRMGAFIPDARREFAERLCWVYDFFPRLKERRNQLAGTLSGGEQQMCAIGRALMSRPQLLLMDEPSAGLAPLLVQQVFELVGRIRGEGYTVLIVEQNVRQILDVVDRAYLLEVGSIRLSGSAAGLKDNESIRKAYMGMEHASSVVGAAPMDIYLIEAIINGLLLGGVLALLALGLNLIFGVIDVVWIAYADLVMCGMYVVYWVHAGYGWPLPLAFLLAILTVAGLGVLVHVLIIAPILGSAPINQLLATGGLLYFLQSFATLLFGTEFRNIGVRLPVIELGDIFTSFSRLIAFAVALVGAVALYLFLKRTYLGTAIRAIAQDRDVMGLMGADQRSIYIATSGIGGALAGLSACLLALQYDVHPFIGNTFGPLVFMICVLGGLGNMIGGFVASFIMSQIIAIGGYYASTEWAYVLAFILFIVLMLLYPRGILAR